MNEQPIKSFRGSYAFLHNGYPCRIEYEAMDYPSAEAAYQAAKSWDIRHRMACQIAPGWKDARALGRKVTPREGWEKARRGIMFEILCSKFRTPETRQKLLATGDAELIWENADDRFWGQVKGEGENWLGKHLMSIRQKLRAQQV